MTSKQMKIYFTILVFWFLSIGCKPINYTDGCENSTSFKPHKVRHFHKSKKYWYYHNTACECRGIDHDLGEDIRNYIVYYK